MSSVTTIKTSHEDEMTLAALLQGKPASEFTADALAGKAYWRLSREQHLAAHLLFDAASERARATGESWRPYRNRAATSLFDAGRVEEAMPRLRAVLDDYEANPEVQGDRHWVEHATQRLLRRAYRVEPERFASRYRELTTRAASIQGRPSPWIHPFQDTLLEYAHELGLKEIAGSLIEVMKGRTPMPRALKQRLRELERWANS